jgi:ubiquinone/menaquinone biosynthesis C-methylase UbiE
MENKISDYNDYNYNEDFWIKSNRHYENNIEQKTLERLIKKIPTKLDKIIDIGCGFGRLFPAYQNHAENYILLDYAKNLLKEAQENIKTNNVSFIQGDFYKMPVEDSSVDLAISIRTLHHVTDTPAFFAEVHRILKPGGYFIFEIPNKKHLLNIFKFCIFRSRVNPFKTSPHKINETFYNYHPADINKKLLLANICKLESVSLSFFRLSLMKRLFSANFLSQADLFLQRYLSVFNITPSIFYLCRKK